MATSIDSRADKAIAASVHASAGEWAIVCTARSTMRPYAVLAYAILSSHSFSSLPCHLARNIGRELVAQESVAHGNEDKVVCDGASSMH